jgi:hypothetical protein
MNPTMTPQEALQLLSNALEPQAQISRQGYIAIQRAIEVLAAAINPQPAEPDATRD